MKLKLMVNLKVVSFLALMGMFSGNVQGEKAEPHKGIEKISISGGYTGPIKEYFEDLLTQFNESQTLYRAEFVGQKDYLEAFKASRAVMDAKSGERTADIYLLPEFGVGEIKVLLGQKSGFIPISDLVPDLMQRSYFAATDKLLSKDGTLYAYPNIAVGVVRYNLDLFEIAQKVDVSLRSIDLNAITTWHQLLEVATRVKNALSVAGKPDIYGITFPWTFAYTVEHSLSQEGDYATTENNGFGDVLKARFDLAKNPHLLTLFETLYQKAQSNVFHYVGDFSNNADELFAKGHCFILLNGANREPVIEHLMKRSKQSFSIGYAQVPRLIHEATDNAPYALKTGGSGLWVTRDSPGVRAFLAYITKPEIQASWSIRTGYLPPDQETLKIYKSLLESTSLNMNQKKVAAIALLEVENKEAGTFTHIVLPQYGDIRGKMFNELFELYLTKGPSVSAGDDALHRHALGFLTTFDKKANEKLDAFEKAFSASNENAPKE